MDANEQYRSVAVTNRSLFLQMKKDPTKPKPAEAEEAAWWRENSELLNKHLRAAVKAGGTVTTEELRRRIEASKKKPATVVALRIPDADLTLARNQSAQKGLPYQTYIKSLLHQALHDDRGRAETGREERVPKGKKP